MTASFKSTFAARRGVEYHGSNLGYLDPTPFGLTTKRQTNTRRQTHEHNRK